MYVGSKEIPHLYPLMQHMVAIAGASIFVGPKLAKDKDLVDTFKNLAIDIGMEIGPNNYFYEAFPTLSRMRQWYLGKYGKAINKHRKYLYRALSPEIDARLAKMEKGGDWERPVSSSYDTTLIHYTMMLTLHNTNNSKTSCNLLLKHATSL